MVKKRIPTRYYLVVLLLITILFFGRNTEIIINNISKNTPLSQISEYSIRSSEKKLAINDLFLSNKNEGYRVIFDIDATEMENISGKKSEKSLNPKKDKISFKLFLVSDYQDQQLVDSFEVITAEKIYNKEFNFITNNKFTSLLLEKEKIVSNYKIVFSNIRVSRLNISNTADLRNLAPSIFGQTEFPPIIVGSIPENLNKNYRLTRKKQKIGQIFTATEEMISKADFKLKFIGDGGSGKYFLELLEIENINGRERLSDYRLAYYCFDQKQAEQLYDQKDEVYHFPLGAKLKKEKKYFIGFSNDGVDFSYFDTLEIIGSKEKNQRGEKTISLTNSNMHEYNSSLYYQLYGAVYNTKNDERVLTDATVQDLGGGTGSYYYKLKGEPSDFLNISRIEGADQKYNVFYDNVIRGISGNANDGLSFIYDFYTIHPFSRAMVTLIQAGGEFVDSEVSYSLDGNNWEIIDPAKEGGSLTGAFEKIIIGDGVQNRFYLKVKCLGDNINRKRIKLFGINYLEAKADIIMKK